MPSEMALDAAPGSLFSNGFGIDIDSRNNHDLLNDFNELEMLLPDVADEGLLEAKLSHPFFDSLLKEPDDPFNWADLGDLPTSFGETSYFIKNEPDSPGDCRSLSSSESTLSNDGKFGLETPPVSPPVMDTMQSSACFPNTLSIPRESSLPTAKKSTILKIDPKNIQIVENYKGLKPIGRRTQVILPKEVLQKVIKIKCDPNDLEPSQLVSTKSNLENLALAKPVLLTNQNLSSNGITIHSRDASAVSVGSLPVAFKSSPVVSVKQEIRSLQKNDLKMKALKRQQRMIKNRESACLSRKKKKEYVTQLESTVANLEDENAKLRVENERLRARMKELESCGEPVSKRAFLNTNARKTTAALAVILMVSINIGSLGIISRDVKQEEFNIQEPTPLRSSRIVRSILWMPPNGRNTSTSNSTTEAVCPLMINQTESLRLEKELRTWIGIDEKRVRYLNSTPKYLRKPSLRHLTVRHHLPKSKPLRAEKTGTTISALDFYRPLFPGALPRRDDTFYVFAFSSDHLLIPAIAHNNTVRPKMSFVLPTVPLNDTVIKNGSIPMMQIDCEVLATHSLQFTEKDFKFIRGQEQHVQKMNQTSSIKMQPSAFKPYFIHRKKFRPSQEFYDSFDLNSKKVYTSPNAFP